MELGEKVKNLRNNNGLSQIELAKKLYVFERFVIDLENGKINPVAYYIIKELSEVFSISVNDLMDDDKEIFSNVSTIASSNKMITLNNGMETRKDDLILAGKKSKKASLIALPISLIACIVIGASCIVESQVIVNNYELSLFLLIFGISIIFYMFLFAILIIIDMKKHDEVLGNKAWLHLSNKRLAKEKGPIYNPKLHNFNQKFKKMLEDGKMEDRAYSVIQLQDKDGLTSLFTHIYCKSVFDKASGVVYTLGKNRRIPKEAIDEIIDQCPQFEFRKENGASEHIMTSEEIQKEIFVNLTLK